MLCPAVTYRAGLWSLSLYLTLGAGRRCVSGTHRLFAPGIACHVHVPSPALTAPYRPRRGIRASAVPVFPFSPTNAEVVVVSTRWVMSVMVVSFCPPRAGLLVKIPRGSSCPPPQAAYSRTLQVVADDGAVGNDVQGGGRANAMPPGSCLAPGVCATVDGASVIRLLPWMLRAAAMERERRRRGCGSRHTAPSR
jgi:hypothetical protein